MGFFVLFRTPNFRGRPKTLKILMVSRELVPREFVPSGIIFLMIPDPREILKHASDSDMIQVNYDRSGTGEISK